MTASVQRLTSLVRCCVLRPSLFRAGIARSSSYCKLYTSVGGIRLPPLSSFNTLANCRAFNTSCLIMAPINASMNQIDASIEKNKVFIFSKSYCPFCKKVHFWTDLHCNLLTDWLIPQFIQVKELFESMNEPFTAVELDLKEDGTELQEALSLKTGKKTVPQVFVNGKFIGGCDDTFAAKEDGTLAKLLKPHEFEYDLIVIGGGSGGLAASKVC